MDYLDTSIVEKLRHYCGRSPWGTDADAPFSCGLYTYATNGILCIRVPGEIENSSPAIQECVEFMSLNFSASGAPTTLKKSDVRGLIKPCTECVAFPELLKNPVMCPECHGSGDVEFENDHNTYTVDCQTCDGTGQVEEGKLKRKRSECSRCWGSGLIPKGDKYNPKPEEVIQVGPAYINPGLVHLLANDFGPITFFAPERHDKAVSFTFVGGDGCIMPLVI
ncbi:MAG TPA: hypothetical protein PKV86_14850 [Syntrophobacteraceae bacterium]|nr:hypothetical protein [Syntrophobacteraceae bacterium]